MLTDLLEALEDAGGVPFLVGGWVRDYLLQIAGNDCDIEVFNLSPDKIKEIASRFGHVNAVGDSFGVFKLRVGEDEYDISVPRRESKSGRGHKGFIPEPDPTMTIEEAAARRDYTINSMLISTNNDLKDPFNGQIDLEKRILRHTSPAFMEDPLRVERGMQFAARFNLEMAPETILVCQEMLSEADTIPVERHWGEWKKLAAKGKYISKGLDILSQTRWIELYPELSMLRITPQDTTFHPEGSVWNHTKFVADHCAFIAERENLNEFDRIVLVLSGICHDLAKVRTTTFDEDGHIRSRGHAEEGEKETKSFLKRIGAPQDVIEHVVPLVREHLAHISIVQTKRVVNRLANRLYPATIAQWVRLVEADHSGRPPLPKGSPAEWALEIAASLDVTNDKPKSILMGRHLLPFMDSGKEMGEVLKAAYQAQLDMEFEDLDGAMIWFFKRRKNEVSSEVFLSGDSDL